MSLTQDLRWSLGRSIALQLQRQTDLLLCTINCFLQWVHLPNMAVGDLAFYYTLYLYMRPRVAGRKESGCVTQYYSCFYANYKSCTCIYVAMFYLPKVPTLGRNLLDAAQNYGGGGCCCRRHCFFVLFCFVFFLFFFCANYVTFTLLWCILFA